MQGTEFWRQFIRCFREYSVYNGVFKDFPPKSVAKVVCAPPCPRKQEITEIGWPGGGFANDQCCMRSRMLVLVSPGVVLVAH